MARKKNQPAVDTEKQNSQSVDWERLLAGFGGGRTFIEYDANRNIFWQGDPADSVFYLRKGRVKIAVTSHQGKEAIVAHLDAGEFFGEGCLAGHPWCSTGGPPRV